jgi:hypothetical protein
MAAPRMRGRQVIPVTFFAAADFSGSEKIITDECSFFA